MWFPQATVSGQKFNGEASTFRSLYALLFFFYPKTDMKLTADLINNSVSHINPVGDRELILRGT